MAILRLPSVIKKKAVPLPTFPLPPELLLLVLEHIRHDHYNSAAARIASVHLSPNGHLASLHASHAVPAQCSLVLISRVSKSWASAANAVLYAFPILTSVNRLHRLALSLHAHPYLATLVRALVLLDVVRDHRWYHVSHFTNRTIGRARTRKDLHDITQLCPALEEYHASFDRTWDTIFCTFGLGRRAFSDLAPSLVRGMRYLTCDGYWTFPHIGPSLQLGECTLPHVVELTLKDVHVGGLRGVSLPMLRTLSMANCVFAPDEQAWLLPADAPALVEATVVDTRLSTTWDEHADNMLASLLVHAGRLERLALGGLAEWELFRNTDWRIFGALRTLKAGIPPTSGCDCSAARFSEGLEALSIFWKYFVFPRRTDIYLAATEREAVHGLNSDAAAFASYRQVRTQGLVGAKAAQFTRLCTDEVPELGCQVKGAGSAWSSVFYTDGSVLFQDFTISEPSDYPLFLVLPRPAVCVVTW